MHQINFDFPRVLTLKIKVVDTPQCEEKRTVKKSIYRHWQHVHIK